MLDIVSKNISYSNEIVLEENYNYQRGVLEEISFSLTKMNHILILIVLFTVCLFSLFILYARYYNRKAFFFEDQDEKEQEKG